MLTLNRKLDERLVFTLPGGGEVWLTVLEIRGAKVRLGVEAPRDVRVDR